PGMLSRALRYRWGVIAVAVALFALSMAALPGLGTSLVPDLVQGQFAFQLRFPAGTPLATTAAGVQRLEEALAGEPGVAHLFSLVGSLPSSASGRRTIGENLARLDLSLIDGADTGVEAKVIARVRAVLSLYPHIDADLVRPSVLTVKPPVAVRVFADDLHDLDTAATIVRDELASLPGVVDLAATAEPGNPEVRIELDRERAAALGVTPELVGTALRAKIRGNVIGEFREGEERLDIRLRAAEISRDRAADVAQLRVHLPGGGSVPVSAVADVEVDRGPAAIYRAGGARMAEISGRSRGANLGEVLARVRSRVASLRLPAGAQVGMAGQDAELQTSFASLKLMLALAIFLVYVVMAAQFESFLHPFIILLAVPLGAAGVVFALLLTHRGISVLVLIGVVMLAGIVVNNAIVLVDAINRRRRDGDASEAAIVAAGRERLRPILMTTITTVLALAPMALGLGAGDELRAPLAITVIGGLSVATLLTLLVIPCLYRAFSRDRAPTAVTGGSPAAAGSVPTGVT
ncbi:MAG: efflux RND transporter permease subunit, partial [Acidobacteriota bacterium]